MVNIKGKMVKKCKEKMFEEMQKTKKGFEKCKKRQKLVKNEKKKEKL